MMKNKLKEIRMREFLMAPGEFADKLNVNLKTYSNWEKGRSKPPLEEAIRISKILNRSVNEIWDVE